MSSIAKMSVMLSLDAMDFKKGLDSAVGTLKKFAIGIASVATARSFIATIKDLENVGDAAASAGVGIEAFTRITGVLDSEDTQAATVALQKLGKVLAELSTGDKATFDKLKEVGLDPVAMAAAGTAGSLDMVAKAFVNEENAIKRQAIALAAFGKSATVVIPALAEIANGSENVASKFGGIMTEEDLARISAAKDALTNVDNSLAGLKNRLAIELSPLVDEIVHGFEMMADALGRLGPGPQGMTLGDNINLGLATLLAAITEGTGGPEGMTMNVIEDFARAQQQKHQKFIDLVNARKKSSEVLAIPDMTAEKSKIDDFASVIKKMAGAWGFAQKAVDGFKSSISDRAFDMFNSTRSPLNKFKDAALVAAAMQGFGKISKEMADKSIAMQFLDLEKTLPNSFGVTSRSMQRGSAEAASFISQFEQGREGQPRNALERVIQVLEAQKAIEAKQEKLQQDIANALRGRQGIALAPSI